jgi:hypothetical protein
VGSFKIPTIILREAVVGLGLDINSRLTGVVQLNILINYLLTRNQRAELCAGNIWDIPPYLDFKRMLTNKTASQPKLVRAMTRAEQHIWGKAIRKHGVKDINKDAITPGQYAGAAIDFAGRIVPISDVEVGPLATYTADRNSDTWYYRAMGSFGISSAQLDGAIEALSIAPYTDFTYDLQVRILKEYLLADDCPTPIDFIPLTI